MSGAGSDPKMIDSTDESSVVPILKSFVSAF